MNNVKKQIVVDPLEGPKISTTHTSFKIFKSINKKKYTETYSTRRHCCQCINSNSISNGEYITTKVVVELNMMEMNIVLRNHSFIKQWFNYLNDMGLKLTWKKTSGNTYNVWFENRVKDKNYYHLAHLNLIRYLWSANYSKFPKKILYLRKKKKLKHLDNWEIFQLAHLTYANPHFYDMTVVRPIQNNPTYPQLNLITSQKFFEKQLNKNLGGNLKTFNIFDYTGLKLKDLTNLRLKKDWLGIYEMLSITYNNFREISTAVCIDSKGFEEVLKVGNEYEINKLYGNDLIRINNTSYSFRCFKVKRFKLK